METIVDLFCGAGGFSRGFHDAGFKTTLAVDNDYYASQTFTLNFPEALVLKENIRDLHSLDILAKVPSPFIVLASPPCESYSRANQNRKSDPFERIYNENSSGSLMLDAIRLIGDLSPQFFIIENVVPAADGKLRTIIQNELAAAGFSDVYFNILSAERYGLPSKRERVFISNMYFDFSSNYVSKTVNEVLSDLPPPGEPHDLINHYEVDLPSKYKKKIPTLEWGKGLISFPGADGKAMWDMVRLDPKDVAPTVMGLSQFIHPYEDRRCTVREHARLMSFPDEHVFIGTAEAQYNQVGEAVPPLIAYLLAKQILVTEKNVVQKKIE